MPECVGGVDIDDLSVLTRRCCAGLALRSPLVPWHPCLEIPVDVAIAADRPPGQRALRALDDPFEFTFADSLCM